MNLSNETIGVLKNFASINSNIAFKTDGTLSTVAVAKDIMARADVGEKFPYEFGIYDLAEFLSAVGMFDDPSLAFDENKKFVSITDGSSSVKYFFSEIDNLVTPKQLPKMPESAISFKLTDTQLNAIRKAAGALSVNELKVVPKGSKADLIVTDVKNATSNEFTLTVDASVEDASNEFVLNIGHFKFNKSDAYDFDISSKQSKQIASVKADGTEYWLALNQN